MSFAEEFGHDIPPDDWDGGYSRRKSKRYTPFTGTHPNNTKFSMTFFGVAAETAKSYLVLFTQGKAWVPKSQVEIDIDNLRITMPFWLFSRLEFIKE